MTFALEMESAVDTKGQASCGIDFTVDEPARQFSDLLEAKKDDLKIADILSSANFLGITEKGREAANQRISIIESGICILMLTRHHARTRQGARGAHSPHKPRKRHKDIKGVTGASSQLQISIQNTQCSSAVGRPKCPRAQPS